MSSHAILMVDDEPHVLKAFQRALRKEPYTLLTAQSGAEGLKLLEARDVSLIISDYSMPGMNGVDLLKTVRTDHPHILGIMLTGQAEIDIAMKAINEAGVYKFIRKPWDDNDLKFTILRALESIDLVTERDSLMRKVKNRDAILNELESKHPGITKVKRDVDGYIHLEK